MKGLKRRDDGKHGRSQMRKVTRTSRRPIRTVEEEHSSEENESLEDEVETRAPVQDKAMAYNALMTLLSDNKTTKKATQKRSHKDQATKPQKNEELDQSGQSEDLESEADPAEASEGEEIAGVNLDEEDSNKNEDKFDDENDMAELISEAEDELGDPFNVHFNLPTEEFIEAQDKQTGKWKLKTKKTIQNYTTMFQVPNEPISTSETIKPIEQLPIKQRVLKNFQDPDQSELELSLMNAMTQYKDVTFPYVNYKNQSYKKLYVLHALNHIYKTRDSILKNTEKLRHYEEQLKQGKSPKEVEYRDQGFTRPKVLILLPTREACYEIVNLLIKYSSTDQQENKKRFVDQFHTSATPPESKPEDFKHYFKGNTNDFFTMGIKFTRKSIKLYSSFYSSDIILASPIGLSMILENPDKRKRDFDFLSSIEVLIIDNAHHLEMQNWDHILTVMKYVNKVPKKFHDADFSRIRMWAINDKCKYFTQRLVFSEYLTPNINNVVNKSVNLSGKMKYKAVVDSENCIMNSVGLKLKQMFQRFDSASPMEDPESRFKFFTNSILNSVSNSTSYDDGLLIIIPSYFDYIRVKDFMYNNTKLTFDAIDEYSSQSKLTKARQEFIAGKTKVLLYTERLHHFRRFEIAGVKNILLYGVPTNPLFYREYLKFIGKSVFNNMADIDLSFMKIIYSKWDAVGLERVVGHQRAAVLCNSVNEMYEFK